MPDFMTFQELADQLDVEVTTVRRNVKRLNLELRKEKTPSRKGASVHCLSVDDVNRLISHFENRDKPDANADLSALDRFGYLYIIQLVPEVMPNRVKIGYTDNLEARLGNIRR